MNIKIGDLFPRRTVLLILAVFLVAAAAKCRQHRRIARELMEDGYRAVSLPIANYDLVAVRAGDRVDVLATFDSLAPGGVKRKLTATVLQNVKVMGVRRCWKPSEKGTLVLKLNPHEAQFAVLGVTQSELSITVRNPGDSDIYPMEMAAFAKLFR